MTDQPHIPDCPGPPPPSAPSLQIPPGACDTHVHVLGPYDAYLLAADRAYTVPEAPLAALETHLAIMGAERAVVAHVSAHGADMRVTLDALDAMGSRARGVIMLLPGMTDADLRAFDAKGVRGVRLSGAFGFPVADGPVREAARRVAPLGWHIAAQPANLAELIMLAGVAADWPGTIVLDHMASRCWSAAESIDQEGFHLIRSLLAEGLVWLKLSAPYHVSPSPYPWPDLVRFGQKLARECPERLLWASDWPHVGITAGRHIPQSGQLLDWLGDIGLDAEGLRRVLVENPAMLYGFD